jgi:hypothetical protein
MSVGGDSGLAQLDCDPLGDLTGYFVRSPGRDKSGSSGMFTFAGALPGLESMPPEPGLWDGADMVSLHKEQGETMVCKNVEKEGGGS